MVQISSSAEGFALSSTLDSCRYKEASSYNCFVDISVLLFDIVETMLKHMGAPLGWLNHHHRRFEKGFTMVEEEELGIAFCTRAKMRRKKARKKAITFGGSSFVGSTERRIHFFVFYRFLRSRISNLNFHLLKLSFSLYFHVWSQVYSNKQSVKHLSPVGLTGSWVHRHPLVTMALREVITWISAEHHLAGWGEQVDEMFFFGFPWG